MHKKNLYENTYRKKRHFSFGQNWLDFLKVVDKRHIENAKKSLINFLGGKENIKGKTFIDIGCGSGLFSLSAYLLGAKKVVSVDIDKNAIKCVRYLYQKQRKPKNWKIIKGSALDEKFIKSLGQFDIVYSWGVLHHTGDMWHAIRNVMTCVDKNGEFYIAIYNKFSGIIDSYKWRKIKKIFNQTNNFVKKIMIYSYYTYIFIGTLLVKHKNPIKEFKNYNSARGMSRYHDVVDWFGGYPYEFATPAEMIDFFVAKNFLLKKIKIAKSGCNEFLFVRK